MAETTTTISRPSPYVEAFGKALTEQVGKQIQTPVATGAFAPTVAGVDPFTQQAQQQMATGAGLGALTYDATGAVSGVGAGTGIGAYEPYLETAGTYAGPTGYQQFMSPYQQQVIDTTLSQFDKQAAIQRRQISDSALSQGAYGGARQGVAQSEYQAASDMNRAGILANLYQQGFGQAQAGAGQAFGQQMGLAAQVPQMIGQQAGQLGALGQQGLAYRQAIADTSAQKEKLAAYEPYQRLGFAQEVLGGIQGGGYGTRFQEAPSQSPLQQALGAGMMGAGILGALK